MNTRDLKRCFSVCALATFALMAHASNLTAQGSADQDSAGDAQSAEKDLYLPDNVVRGGNDFDDENSDFSFKRMVQGDNVAIFWHKDCGDDPAEHEERGQRFDVNRMLAECERYYEYYVNDLKLVEGGSSVSDKHKLLVFVRAGGGAATGGGSGEVGVMRTPAARVNREPYGVLAHEMGHCFQFYARTDGAGGGGGEMAAQYMLWQVLPEWLTFENYHLVDFMNQTHLAFGHRSNMYHSCHVLEYWSNKHGIEFWGELTRATERGEDLLATYKRINELDQDQLNDVMFDAYRRFITWDMERIEEVASQYANQHHTSLQEVGDGWHQIAADKCPQNYGYNGIQLNVPAAGTEVQLQFKGMAGAEGFSQTSVDKAGWRYGFVAHLSDNTRVYGDLHKDAEGTASFNVPENTEHLWLVVMGAPTEHLANGGRRGSGRRGRGAGGQGARGQGGRGERGGGQAGGGNAEWPYQIKLTGATVHESAME